MKADLDGMELNFEDNGKGLPLVFLHGFPLNQTIWQPQTRAFQNQYRIITPDLRGHGGSDAPKGIYTMETLARDLFLLLQLKRCVPAIIAGHSMGGYVALAFYRMHADLVKGLILISTRAGDDTEEAKSGREALAAAVEKQGSRPVVEKMLPKMMSQKSLEQNPNLRNHVEAMMSATPSNGLVGALHGMAAREDSSEILRNIQVPTLVVGGTDDHLIPYGESVTMAQAIPTAQLHLIDDAGHLPSLEKPDELNRVIGVWLRKIKGV